LSLRPDFDVLGTVNTEDLLKIIKTNDHRPISIECLGTIQPPQLVVVARLLYNERTRTKRLLYIEIKDIDAQ
jgi:hypothetical protein